MTVPLLLARESAKGKGGYTESKWIDVAIAGRVGGRLRCVYILPSIPLVS